MENGPDALVRLHAPLMPGKIGGAHERGERGRPSNLLPEPLHGPNAGLTEVLMRVPYVTTAFDPMFRLNADCTGHQMAHSDVATSLDPPALPFSLVFRAEPGREDVLLYIASAYEAASDRRIPPPDFGRLTAHG